MISPDRTDTRVVPQYQQTDAALAGWEHATKMVHPQTQDKRWVPASQTSDAMKSGYVSADIPAALTSKPSEQFQGLGSAAKEQVTGLVTGGGLNPVSLAKNVYKGITEDIPAVYKAYEAARQSGASIGDAYTAANAKAKDIQNAKNGLAQAVKEFNTNPNKAAWNAVLQLGTVALGGELLKSPEASTEVAAPATPAPAESSAVNPIETAVTKSAVKSGLPEGEPASVAPTGEDIQPALQQGIRDTVNKVAAQNGLDPVNTSIRDIGKELGDQFYNRSKNTFQQVQDTTGVNLTDIRNKIATLSDKIEAAVDDPEKAGQLEQQKLGLENTADQAFNTAKEKGIDAGQARDDWKKYNASYEFGQHIRNSAEGTLSNPTINPSKLAPRLQKFNESTSPTQAGRLQQLAGDNAATLVEHAENARTAEQAIKEFVPSSPTGQQAMQDLLRSNTTGKAGIRGKVAGQIDWNGAVRDFENLPPEEQIARFGSDVDKVRQYFGKQVQRQIALNLLKKAAVKGAGAVGFGALGTLGYELAK
jgi:hypothetical protein